MLGKQVVAILGVISCGTLDHVMPEKLSRESGIGSTLENLRQVVANHGFEVVQIRQMIHPFICYRQAFFNAFWGSPGCKIVHLKANCRRHYPLKSLYSQHWSKSVTRSPSSTRSLAIRAQRRTWPRP